MNMHLPVVVGIDDDFRQAVAFGVEEARSRGVPVRLVYAYGWALGADVSPVYRPLPLSAVAELRTAAAKLLDGAAGYAAEISDAVEIVKHAAREDPVPHLIRESEQATVLVLGSRKMGALGSLVLGSVSAPVAARAACPVVVMRGPSGLEGENPGVVVGIEPREGSQSALAFAFDYASRHGRRVDAVMCWRRDPFAEMLWRASPPAPERADELLAEALAGYRADYPDVAVQAGVVRDRPADALVSAAAGQHLLVVGSRGHHALSATMLGSVNQAVLHHATCPVAVVPIK